MASNYAFKAHADSMTGTTRISLTMNGGPASSVEIDSNCAGIIAGDLLGAVRTAYDSSGKPPPDGPIDRLMVISCSGIAIAPGQSQNALMLVFYFGDATLGISVPKEEARIVAQRLLTVAADGPPQ